MSKKERAGILGACIIAIVTLVVVLVMAGAGERPPTPPPHSGLVSEQVSWPIGETTVYATITRPAGDGPYPAVVLVGRTGLTDRDWNLPQLPGTNGSGRLLAEELARHDFVVIRYDRRYVGQGAADNLPHLAGKISLSSHMEEIAGAVETLLAQDYLDMERIYLLSHGEGALLAVEYHLEYGEMIAGLVLAAPPCCAISALFIRDVQAQFQQLPNADQIVAGCESLVADFIAGSPFAPHPDVPDTLNNYVSSLHDPRSLPFLREIWPLNPAHMLTQLDVPALVVMGKKDVQVDWQADGALLQTATVNITHIAYEFPENADHVLKYQPKPREELTQADARDYNMTGRVLDPEAVRVIIDWLMHASQAN